MLSRNKKEAFYTLAGPLMKLNGFLYRKFRAPNSGKIKVHLGPGQKRYLPGWLNLDANVFSGNADIWVDLRNNLPFNDNSVSAMYSHHMIEHLPSLEKHLSEVFRCLRPGGIYRVGGPSGDAAIQKFNENDINWFGEFPDKRDSIGGRFENFIFCRQEHLTILTQSFLTELLEKSGFTNIATCLPTKETRNLEVFADCLAIEHESDFDTPHTLIIEAEKP